MRQGVACQRGPVNALRQSTAPGLFALRCGAKKTTSVQIGRGLGAMVRRSVAGEQTQGAER